MRYITAVAAIQPEGAVNPITWRNFVDAICQEPSLMQALTLLGVFDLRKTLREGGTMRLTDTEWNALRIAVERPTTLSPAFIFADGAEAFFRAIADAPTEEPK